jgi:hypothetical protein
MSWTEQPAENIRWQRAGREEEGALSAVRRSDLETLWCSMWVLSWRWTRTTQSSKYLMRLL